ncbi:MAG: hypothetical protein ABIK73_06025 [candidate division WOR-3 bacterium]
MKIMRIQFKFIKPPEEENLLINRRAHIMLNVTRGEGVRNRTLCTMYVFAKGSLKKYICFEIEGDNEFRLVSNINGENEITPLTRISLRTPKYPEGEDISIFMYDENEFNKVKECLERMMIEEEKIEKEKQMQKEKEYESASYA